MPTSYASGKHAHGFCDVCNFRVKLHALKALVVNEKNTNVMACPTCWEPDHPQYRIGRIQIDDPQALRNPRPDPSLQASRES
jgi:hypothetical protein